MFVTLAGAKYGRGLNSSNPLAVWNIWNTCKRKLHEAKQVFFYDDKLIALLNENCFIAQNLVKTLVESLLSIGFCKPKKKLSKDTFQ